MDGVYVYDVLDTRMDTLYCSYVCARAAGVPLKHQTRITERAFEARRSRDGPGEGWGALCPTCEGEYHGF